MPLNLKISTNLSVAEVCYTDSQHDLIARITEREPTNGQALVMALYQLVLSQQESERKFVLGEIEKLGLVFNAPLDPVEEVTKRLNSMIAERDAAEKEVDELEEIMGTLQSEYATLEGRYEALTDKLADAEEGESRLRSHYDAIILELEKTDERLREERKQHTETKAAHDKLIDTCNQLEQNCKTACGNLNSVIIDNSKLEEKLKACLEEQAQLVFENKELQRSVEDEVQSNGFLREELLQTDAKLKALENQYKSTFAKFDEANLEKYKLEKLLAAEAKLRNEVTNERDTLKEKYASLEILHKNFEAGFNATGARLATVARQLNDAHNEIYDCKQMNKVLTAELEDERKVNKAVIDDLRVKLEDMREHPVIKVEDAVVVTPNEPVNPIAQFFDKDLDAALKSTCLADINTSFLFEVTGSQGGCWFVWAYSDGQAGCMVSGPGTASSCYIKISDEDFVMCLEDPAGSVPLQLYFNGRMKVSGDPLKAMKFEKLLQLARTNR